MGDAVLVTIRQATGPDLRALILLWRSAVEASHTFLSPDDIDWYERIVVAYLPRMQDLRVAETSDGALLGFIGQDDGEIQMLFVDPKVHGQGVGTRLLEDVGEQFAVLRVDVNEQNPSGRAFYRSRGFGVVGRSELDGQGRAFPLMHLRRDRTQR